MTNLAAPTRLTYCAGRVVGEPFLQKVTFYNGTPGQIFHGRRWTVDGEHVHPAAALAFRAQWAAQNSSTDSTGSAAAA